MNISHSRSITACCGTLRAYASISASLAAALCTAQPPLPLPITINGPVYDLSVQQGTHEFHPGEVVDTYGINGSLLGPTLILQAGEQVTLNVTNNLPDLTTMHWHGLHVSAMNDGGPHSLILPNTTWSPSFTVLNKAGTYWYHPHSHGLTDYQVSMGLAGMIIVQDAQEAALPLPRTYGVDDIPLILQTKAIVDGQIALHTGLDSVVLANGAREPRKELPAQVVRLRCLNGSSERTFLLGFSNGMSFQVIATDGGLLDAPVTTSRARLMPGERLELLVDLGSMEGDEVRLMTYASELQNGIVGSPQVGGGMIHLDGYLENELNGTDHALVSFSIVAPIEGGVTALPTTLVPLTPYAEEDADITRTFDIAPQTADEMAMIEGPFTINGAVFDMGTINVTVPLGNTEIWVFTNNSMVGHPVHIHDIQFNVIGRTGAPVEAWEHGWKDVVYVPAMGSATVITRFDDFADPDMPYMYHCHMLMHEDEGMMGQFLVLDPNGISERGSNERLLISPNPTNSGTCNVQWPLAHGEVYAQLLDPAGRVVSVRTMTIARTGFRLDLPEVATGTYTLLLTDASGHRAHGTLCIGH